MLLLFFMRIAVLIVIIISTPVSGYFEKVAPFSPILSKTWTKEIYVGRKFPEIKGKRHEF